jgi:hypothetical protein
MAIPPDRAPLERLGGPDPRLFWVVGGAAVILAIAILKPWQSAPAQRAHVAAPSPGPTATAPAPTATPLDEACLPAGPGWTVTFVEASAGSPDRTWYSMEPADATGPLDPSIPLTRVYRPGVLALGYCVATSTRPLRSVAATSAWRVAGTTAVELELSRAAPFSPADPDRGSLFVPVGSSRLPGASRGPDTYVFEVRYACTPSASAWFAVQVVEVPAPASGPPSLPPGSAPP